MYQKFSQSGSGLPATRAFYMLSSSGALTDASFIRLKNLSLSYSLPKTMLKKAGIKRWRIFCQAQNLLTFTKYEGFDPENQSATSLPPIKMITIGSQITF
jgi:hypothetical protein